LAVLEGESQRVVFHLGPPLPGEDALGIIRPILIEEHIAHRGPVRSHIARIKPDVLDRQELFGLDPDERVRLQDLVIQGPEVAGALRGPERVERDQQQAQRQDGEQRR